MIFFHGVKDLSSLMMLFSIRSGDAKDEVSNLDRMGDGVELVSYPTRQRMPSFHAVFRRCRWGSPIFRPALQSAPSLENQTIDGS